MNKLTVLAMALGLALVAPAPAQAQQVDPAVLGLGAQVYSDSCGRCHNARPASERTDKEWMAIVAHMRARANMSKTRAEAVLAFLQATNAPEPTAAMAPPSRATPAKPGGSER